MKNYTLSLGNGQPFLNYKSLIIVKTVVVFLLFGAFNMQVNAYAQTVSIDKKDIAIIDVFRELKLQTDFNFICSSAILKETPPLDVHLTNVPLEEALRSILAPHGLIHEREGKNIVVRREKKKPNYSSTRATSQQQMVSGRVTDGNGKPLAGASVTVKGSLTIIATDANGQFTITADRGDLLVFSSVGYAKVEQPVGSSNVINVQLAAQETDLEEVVVIGYGAVAKKDLTGAVSTISGESLQQIPVQRVDQMLQGRAAGVDVKSVNGAPGSGTTIRIRGSRSINASNEPLYVIDGVVDAGDLNTINPADIASIDILKDASAAAIYGSRASNGVIIITTKQGTPGKDKVTAAASYGVSHIPSHPKMLNAEQYIGFINEAYIEMGQPELYPNPDSILRVVGSEGTPWIESVFQTGHFANYDLAVSGGNESLTYRLSGNITDQKGTAIRSSFDRYQVRLNMTKHLNESLRFGVNANYSHYVREPGSNINFGSNEGWSYSHMFLPPTMPMHKGDGTFESYNPSRYVGGGHVNTSVATASLTDAYTKYNDLLATIYGEYDIIAGLTFRSTLGTTVSHSRYNFYRPSYMPLSVVNGQEFGDALSDIYLRSYLLNENTLTFKRAFGEHSLNAVGGFTYQRRNSERLYVRGGGLTNDIIRWNDFASVPQDQRNTISNYNDNTQSSFVARLAYDYGKKYYLTLTGRYDGASNFALRHKWAFFPSAAFKWRIIEEEFMKQLKGNTLSDLALRLSYGTSGNQGIANYQSLATLSSDPHSYVFGGVPRLGYTQGRLENRDLRWEKSRQLNIGADASFLNGRIQLSTNYYQTETRDLLLTVQIPRQTGYANRLVNLGKTNSRGFEFEVRGDVIKRPDFTWNAVVNLSTNQQEVTDIGPLVRVLLDDNGYGAQTNFLEIGVPIGAAYGVKYEGTWKNQAEIDAELAKPAGERTLVSNSNFYRPGKPRYADTNGDGVLNIDDYHYLGTPHPKRFGGFGSTFSYKAVALDFFFNFAHGHSMFNNMEFFAGTGTYLTNQMSYMADRWSPDNPYSDIPGVNSRDHVPSTRLLQDASFLRLSQLNLSVDLANYVFKQTGKQLVVYVGGRNLLLFTKYRGYDPEVNSSGTSSTVRAKDDGAYPNSRIYNIGINLTL
ncbi:TonB-dependent receptor [Parapedobacter deserti]|uniref:TonB-dependent receptor n=1 Tax=Parapedobacter deserti TaxID=1912957 RepID=A0ABV7JGQ4_9SPHI